MTMIRLLVFFSMKNVCQTVLLILSSSQRIHFHELKADIHLHNHDDSHIRTHRHAFLLNYYYYYFIGEKADEKT